MTGTLERAGLNSGKKARLHRILHQHGLGNGTALFLPYDQGLEHGPRDAARTVEAEIGVVRRRIRALERHRIPRLYETLARTELELEEAERADAVGRRLARPGRPRRR